MNLDSKKILNLVLSLLIFMSAFSNVSFAENQTQDNSMPCHHLTDGTQDQACPKSGENTCECCEFAMPVAITFSGLSADSVLFISGIFQEKNLPSYCSQPQLPPFRPPRFLV